MGNAKAVEALVGLLKESRDPTILRNAAFAIANLCINNGILKHPVLHLHTIYSFFFLS